MADAVDFQPIILAAGKGTRMNTSLPKVLVGLQGKPLIQRLLDSLVALEKNLSPVIVVGHKYDLVQSYLGPKYIYAFQEGQLGTAHAVKAARPRITAKNVLVLYGDMPFIKPGTLSKFLALHDQSDSLFTMLTSQVPEFENQYAAFLGFGRIIRDAAGQLSKIVEYVAASPEERAIKELNSGIYLFNADWLWQNLDQVQKNKQGEYYLTDLVEIAVKAGTPIYTANVDPLEVYGINTPQQLEQAAKFC